VDSPLEGDGFELPVRGRGQSGCRPFWVGCADRVRVRARRFWDSAVSATRLGDLSRRRRGGPPHRSIDEGSVFRVEHRVAGAMAPDRRDRPQFGLSPSTSLSSSTSSATGCHPRPATRRRSTAAVTRISRRPTMSGCSSSCWRRCSASSGSRWFTASRWGRRRRSIGRHCSPTGSSRIAPICGSAKTSAHNFVFFEGVKAALTADPVWQDGWFATPPTRGFQAMGRVYAAGG